MVGEVDEEGRRRDQGGKRRVDLMELDKVTELWFCLGLGVWGSGDTGADWSA